MNCSQRNINNFLLYNLSFESDPILDKNILAPIQWLNF